MVVSNLSFLSCDVFIKFNCHEYMEKNYLKKYFGVAEDKNFRTAGVGTSQRASLTHS